MNIAIFTDSDFGPMDAVTTTLRAVLRYAPPEIQPCIYGASEFDDEGPGYFVRRGVGPAIPMSVHARFYLPRLRAYLDRVRRDRVDVVHMTTPGPVGLAAIYVARHAHLPLLGSIHADIAARTETVTRSRRMGDLMRRYVSWTYRQCDRLFVPSERAPRIAMAAGVESARTDLWRGGVDTHLYSPAKRSPALRERWRVCDRRPAIISVGHLSGDKGLGLLCSFQSALHRRHIEHRLVLVGDGPCRGALQDAMPDAILPGVLAPADLAIALASADLFLLPDPHDVTGEGVLDAQASGLPALVPTLSGAEEYVHLGDAGAVATAGNAEAFAEAASLILRDAERRQCMAAAARARALALRWEASLAPLYSTYVRMATVGRQSAHALQPVSGASDSAIA
jgi:glycosyltransferase involved in cell wall biosynthesis